MREDEYVECGMCGGPVRPLGKLGSTSHGRCRDCGANQVLDDVFDEDSEEDEQDSWID